jgi:5-methylcytosine-specific restriction enzyme A
MPKRPPRPCPHPGCRELTEGGRCAAHTDKRWAKQKKSARERGYSVAWEKARKGWLRKHPICRVCARNAKADANALESDLWRIRSGDAADLDPDRIADVLEAVERWAADQLDHIVPHRGDRERFWDRRNWQSICTAHHIEKSARERASWKRDGLPRDVPYNGAEIVLVCGPPGAGKTTWAKAQANGDVVLDLDDIKAEMSGRPLRECGQEWTTPALDERDRRLAELEKGQRAWVIATAPTPGERLFWRERLRTRVVMIAPPPETCAERIDGDDRPDKERDKRLAREWWRRYEPAACDEHAG